MFKTVIWATDGSETADEALPFAKGLVEAADGKLVVVHSSELYVGSRAAGLPVHADEDELQVKIQRQVAGLREEDIDVAREVEADVIVVGTRGHSPIAGVLVGSVTQRLLHIAPCPVLAVPSMKQRAKRAATHEHVATTA